MTKQNYIFGFLAILTAAVFFTGLCRYTSLRGKDYIYLGEKAYSRTMLREAELLLSSYEYEGYEAARHALALEYVDLSQYRLVQQIDQGNTELLKYQYRYTDNEIKSILSKYALSDSQAAQRQELLLYCIERLDYAAGYTDYIETVTSNVAELSRVSLFNDSARKKIIRTGIDFYGFENIHVSAMPDAGIRLVFSSALSNVLALLAAFLCALLLALRCRAGISRMVVEKYRIGFFAAVFAFFLVLLYAVDAAAVDSVVGLGDLRRPVQSVSDFVSCPFRISLGMLLLFRIAFQTAACLTVYLFLAGLFLCRKKAAALTAAVVFFALDGMLFFSGSKIGFFAEFCPEKVLGRYGKIWLFGEAWNPAVLLLVLAVLLAAAAMVFAAKGISHWTMLAKEQAEQQYFEAVNQKYTETRLLRHDIRNHLAAVAMLLEEGDVEGARKYLGDVSEQLDEISPPVKTGSTVLDAVLFRKVSAAKEQRIAMQINFAVDFHESRISDYDLCSLFGNLLDNAADACAKLPVDERKITLKVKKQMDMVCIFCENRYCEIKKENGRLATLKPEKELHGLGLKRIAGIAQKYGGTVKITTENNLFSITVLLTGF